MNTVTINGKTYRGGNSISVINGVVTIDGRHVEEDAKNVMTITVEGSIGELKTDKNVVCQNVTGNVEAGGSVNADDVNGNINAGGSVNCDDVGGNINANGSVNHG
jgi:hypothetical protein